MSQYGMYFTKLNLNLHDEDDEDNILTEYEKNFSDKGSRIYRMEAKFIKLINNILNQHTKKRSKYILTSCVVLSLLLFMINISTYDKHPCNI